MYIYIYIYIHILKIKLSIILTGTPSYIKQTKYHVLLIFFKVSISATKYHIPHPFKILKVLMQFTKCNFTGRLFAKIAFELKKT